jgi:DNA-binding GntR family transcriptional regulator
LGEVEPLTTLQSRVARKIAALARRENLKAGEHLTESLIAERIGVSRTPVNAALRYLVGVGMLVHDPNRGYFLNRDAQECLALVEYLFQKPDEPLYLQIVDDRLRCALPDLVSESELMRRYGVARSTLRNVLSRIQQEGWVEHQVGNGWQFLPLIDSPESYDESYLFRAAIEPAGVLAATFQFRPAELAALVRRQKFIADSGFESMTAIELFEANSEFHETVAAWSGNRFIAQSIKRVDGLRRLIEYRQAKLRPPRREAAVEHLAILDAISRQDNLSAASLLREHLEGARRSKVFSHEIFGGKSVRSS